MPFCRSYRVTNYWLFCALREPDHGLLCVCFYWARKIKYSIHTVIYPWFNDSRRTVDSRIFYRTFSRIQLFCNYQEKGKNLENTTHYHHQPLKITNNNNIIYQFYQYHHLVEHFKEKYLMRIRELIKEDNLFKSRKIWK